MRITNDVLYAIRRHGEETYPEECCGLLIGRMGETDNVIAGARAVQNRSENRRIDRYIIDPADFRSVDREARRDGFDIVGIYHSHPDHPARPSPTDLEQATFPGYTYVIVSIDGGRAADLTAWTLADDRSRFLPQEIHILADSNAAHHPTSVTRNS